MARPPGPGTQQRGRPEAFQNHTMGAFDKRAPGLLDADTLPTDPDDFVVFGINGFADVFIPPTIVAPNSSQPDPTATVFEQLGSTSVTNVGAFPSVSLPVPPPSPGPFTININWDSSVATAPSGFTTDIIAAVQYLESQFIDAVTININVGYKEVAGHGTGGALGQSLANLAIESYAGLANAIGGDARTAADASVVAALPASSPVSGATWWTTTAEAKALGLSPANGSALDGSVGFGASSLFTYGMTATSGTVAPGTYDFFSTVLHEFTEVMGRELLTGTTQGGLPKSFLPMDLLHFSAAGVHDFSATAPGYFSADGGTTDLGAFNTITNGDPGDWASSVARDPFDAFSTSGVFETLSANDLTVMDAIGWDPVGSSSPIGSQGPTPPTGVSFTPQTASLAHAQGRGGLVGGSPLVAVAQVGGTASDQYSYALSGPDAGSFNLTAASGGALLTAGVNGIAGAKTGAVYALTVTATDLTASGNPSAASAIDVVVGGNGNDTIFVSGLPGIAESSPTFIHGLGGNDTMNGTGMMGPLYFDGGAGADTMTGGSGTNVYEFGAAADSSRSTMDIVTNFNVAVDLIDLTGIISPLVSIGQLALAATSIAPASIGWQTSNGDTFVYVNTSNRYETLPAANMEIGLSGSIALTDANFAHF